MKKKLLLSVMLVLALTAVMAVNAFAADRYSYTDNLGGTPTTLFTEEGSSTKTWTMYPNIKLNLEGRFVLSGSPVSVNYSNKDSYKGYFYEQGGRLYQLDGCNFEAAHFYIEQSDHLKGTQFSGNTDTTVWYRGIEYTDNPYFDCLRAATGTAIGSLNDWLRNHSSGTHQETFYGPFYAQFPHGPYISAEDNHYLYEPWVEVESLTFSTGPSGFGGQYSTIYCNAVRIYGRMLKDTYKWDFKPITVVVITFDSQDGSVSQLSKAAISGSTYGTLPTPTRTGYSFNGWFTASNGGGTRIIESSIVGASNITLYADWQINQYTVSFDSNGGSEVAPITQNYNTEIAEPTAPMRTGHTFAGWCSDTELTLPVSFPYTIGANDTTLYAKWTINQYTVSFDSNGGSEVAPVTQDYDTTVAEPTAPTRTGYKFTGWYLEPELTNAVVWPLTIGAGDITLYAKWTIGQYTVSFNSNGGSEVVPITQDYGTEIVEPTEPTRSGYTFGGWCSDAELTLPVSFPYTMGANDITLYAAWTVNQYAVRFESNGGSAVASVTQDYGTQVDEPAAPTRSGHTFDGWYTDEELATPAAFPITLGTADKTLYAKWTVIAPSGGGGGSGDGIITPEPSYTVNFDSNGADELFSQVVKGGDVINIPPRPIRDGYIFEGWYKDSACTILWDSSEKVTKSMTLFAKWRAVNPEDELNKPDKPQKDTDAPENVNDNPTDNKDDDGDNPKKTELHAVQVPNELEICGIVQDDDDNNPQPAETKVPDELKIRGGGKDKTITKDIATNKKTDAFSWDKLSRIAVPFLALALFLLISTLVVILISRDKRRKRAYFYDNSGEICAATIRGNKVDITNAVSQALGKQLKVKISEWYMNKARGHELELCYNGTPIGSVTINDENVFEIDIS